MPGYLKYQDTSTGQLVVEHRTKLGACNAMTQNFHNAVIHLGHQNGCVTLWTPNLPHPAVQLLAHLGPVVSVSVDPSQGGRYMATAGRDGTVKVWDCRNWKGAVRDWTVRGTGTVELDWSARGYLAVANSGNVNVSDPAPYSMRCRLKHGTGLHAPHNTYHCEFKSSTSVILDPSYPSPATHLRSVRAASRYFDNRPRCRGVKYTSPWCRRAKL